MTLIMVNTVPYKYMNTPDTPLDNYGIHSAEELSTTRIGPRAHIHNKENYATHIITENNEEAVLCAVNQFGGVYKIVGTDKYYAPITPIAEEAKVFNAVANIAHGTSYHRKKMRKLITDATGSDALVT